MNTTSTLDHLASLALDLATDHGQREWRGGQPPVKANALGGFDFTTGPDTFRLLEDDTEVVLHRFTNGSAMLLTDTARFSRGFSYVAAEIIAEALR
jgi:hypothetical protein